MRPYRSRGTAAIALVLSLSGPLACGHGGDESPCGDTRTDRMNCGACGHSCWGGACVDGACQPAQLSGGDGVFVAPSDGAYAVWPCGGDGHVAICSTRLRSYWDVRFGARQFAQLDDGVTSLAIADGVVYWGNADGVYSCPATGCEQPWEPIAAANAGETLIGAQLVAAGSQLLWTLARDTQGATSGSTVAGGSTLPLLLLGLASRALFTGGGTLARRIARSKERVRAT